MSTNSQQRSGISFVCSIVFFLFFLCLAVFMAQHSAGGATTPTHKEQNGRLPTSGTVAVRSGLAWMDENSVLFQEFKASIEPLLTAKGLTVAQVSPSSLAPFPQDFGATGEGAKTSSASKKQKSGALKLQNYAGAMPTSPSPRPGQQAFSPQIMAFARSQQEGNPVLHQSGRIPGRLPIEVGTTDPDQVNYVLICRFSAVSPSFSSHTPGASPVPVLLAYTGQEGLLTRNSPAADASGLDIVTAAGPVRGVDTFGFGAPAPAAPPPSGYGSSPRDFERGYEGISPVPGDIWHRETDFRARDYMQRNSPPPPGATEPSVPLREIPPAPETPSLPKPPLPGDEDMSAVTPGPARKEAPQSRRGPQSALPGKGKAYITGYVLEMECYDLGPAKEGKPPRQIWSSVVQQRADAPDLAAALPGMIKAALGAKAK